MMAREPVVRSQTVSRLSIFPDHPPDVGSTFSEPVLVSDDPQTIQQELHGRGIGFERWPVRSSVPQGADQATVLQAFSADVKRVMTEAGHASVDVLRVTPSHPDRTSLRRRFLGEHTHAEDEVRFFVEGRGLFCLHIGREVLAVLCEQDDLIHIPAGTRHWFDMGEQPQFCVLRFHGTNAEWLATFTGDPIAERFPTLE